MSDSLEHGPAGLVVVSHWSVRNTDEQHSRLAALARERSEAAWPRGLLLTNYLSGNDGNVILHYEQWTTKEAFQKAPAAQAGPPNDQTEYRLYRGRTRQPYVQPGCIVIVSIEFEAASEERQRRWVDTVFEALDAEENMHPGGISGRFHLSTDGTRVLNYAEWTSEEAHREAIENSGQGAIGSGPKWRDVQNFPGVVARGFRRYRLYKSLVKPDGDA